MTRVSPKVKAYFVLSRKDKKSPQIARYYSGLSIFPTLTLAERRARTLRRRNAALEIKILPWHSEMGEMDRFEMWASGLEAK